MPQSLLTWWHTSGIEGATGVEQRSYAGDIVEDHELGRGTIVRVDGSNVIMKVLVLGGSEDGEDEMEVSRPACTVVALASLR